MRSQTGVFYSGVSMTMSLLVNFYVIAISSAVLGSLDFIASATTRPLSHTAFTPIPVIHV